MTQQCDGNNCKRIRIDILCRGSQSPLQPASPRTPLALRQRSALSVASKYAFVTDAKAKPDVKTEPVDVKRETSDCPKDAPNCTPSMDPSLSYFFVNLFVAAVADGVILPDSGRKKHYVLEQIIRNVSKEQNIMVKLGREGITRPLKMRVFVQNSIEARAVIDYITAHPNQAPAPFVILSRKLPMAVEYAGVEIDASCAAVADRLRKQAKTRAVRMVREAIGDPLSSVSSPALEGHAGPTALLPSLHHSLVATARP
eukprot:CAMPEP_0181307304 /NCGR_PEP_ID=MMETSP1101-20121128/10798_1 /TAXON_ID=46948 /ORGANISM="Rhodomonas abbreviata, Strain Caron Lab Isolate" /LENGTH=255 /DNA_ID=CAMNT_0023413491 /DNA_START=317 /DNA_END=1080 /DNA_ORIENTATION=+